MNEHVFQHTVHRSADNKSVQTVQWHFTTSLDTMSSQLYQTTKLVHSNKASKTSEHVKKKMVTYNILPLATALKVCFSH